MHLQDSTLDMQARGSIELLDLDCAKQSVAAGELLNPSIYVGDEPWVVHRDAEVVIAV